MREKLFSANNMPTDAFELNELGIPAIAYWNTEGDTPIYAEQEVSKNAWHIWFLIDGQCAKLGIAI
jgi:hypothetical protein